MFNRARRSAKTNSVSVDSFKTLKAQKFVGGAKPFPMNPFFIPKITISDKTRTQIYSLYKSSPEQWTPRALAEQFGISIARTDAILRLKALAASMEEKDIAIQTKFVEGMEGFLKPLTVPFNENKVAAQYEALRETVALGVNPFIQLLDEENHLTPEDAAKILQLTPYENIAKKLDLKANKMFQENPTHVETAPIEINPILGGKVFRIVDISNPTNFKYTVRDCDGVLRNASKAEIYMRRNAKTNKFMM